MHFNTGKLLSKLLFFINSKNLRTIRKLIAYENFQDYSSMSETISEQAAVLVRYSSLRTIHL